MLNILLLVLLAAYFTFISYTSKKYIPGKQTVKITKPLSKIINIAPLPGIIVFTILFTFVLKGRFLERASHAVLVFAVWLYATQFYQYILTYFEERKIFISSIIGMSFSVVLAIIFTPLDRYVKLLYSYMDGYSIFFSCGLFALFYAVVFFIVKGFKSNN